MAGQIGQLKPTTQNHILKTPQPRISTLARPDHYALQTDKTAARMMLQTERDIIQIEKSLVTPQNAKTLQRSVKWAGRGIGFYKDAISLADEASRFSKLSKATRALSKSPGGKALGFAAKAALFYFSYVIIKDAMAADRANGDTRKIYGVPLGRETLWSIGSEAISYTPYSTFAATPLFNRLRKVSDAHRDDVLTRGGGTSKWADCTNWSQKSDWVMVNLL